MKAILPAPERLGAELTDLGPEITQRGELEPRAAAELRALTYEHKLVVLRGMQLDPAHYVAFARALGTPQIYFQANYHHPDFPEIFVSSNEPMNGAKVGVAGTGRYWHTDCQFFDTPLPLTMVSPQTLPKGKRETHYADMGRAFEALPADLREFALNHRAVHEAKWRYKVQPCDIDKSITEILAEFGAITPAVTHPMVIEHPALERRSLYVSEGFTVGIDGLGIEAGKAMLQRFFEASTRDEFVHVHPWEAGDILLWDNRQLMHMAGPTTPGEPSTSFRIGVYDEHPFYRNV